MSMSGRASWTLGDRVYEANRLEATQKFNGESVTFEITAVKLKTTYNVALREGDHIGLAKGMWAHEKNITKRGACEARIFRCADGSVILLGKWDEEGHTYEWFTYLQS